MFPPARTGKPPQPKKKMPRIIPRPRMMAASLDNEMTEPPGPEEQEPQMPMMGPAPGLGRLKNLRAMLTSRHNIRK